MIRAINDRLALDLLVERGPLSRAQLVTATGLSKQTVAELIDRLVAAGLVQEAGEGGHGTRGPSARVYAVVASRAYVLGAEITGTEVNASVADITGRVVGEAAATADAGGNSVELVRETLARAVAGAGIAPGRLRATVVGTPGTVDPQTGDIGLAWDLPGWYGGLREVLASDLGCPVTLENEVNLSAVAEHRVGAAADRENFALLAMGHGIGMAVVLGGRLHRGDAGAAGEIGYLALPGAGLGRLPEPGTPYTGGFQGLAGEAAIVELARRHGMPRSSAAEAVAAAPEGSAFLAELVDRITMGITSVCAVLDPGVVVLAGPVGRAVGARLTEEISAAAVETSPIPVQLRTTAVEGDAVLAGALLTALDSARAEVFGPAGAFAPAGRT
ncbi:ROK family transcriptional regulator [Streptomyces sp. NPDC006367]|uniref:ROK family transcriptional regulator n=1 Tax=unclassified Streptomyces TaxID=2593676 RepID=UPI0033B87DE6